MKRRILFLSKGEDSASTRYRALQFFDALRADGFEPRHRTVAGGPASLFPLLREARNADIVVVLRRTFHPFVLRVLRGASRRLVFDFDDAIFMRDDGTESARRARRFAAMAAAADEVWAGNRYLADAARRHQARVFELPTVLDVRRYPAGPRASGDYRELIWIGSSATAKYLDGILPALEHLSSEVAKLRLTIVSDFARRSDRYEVRNLYWSPEAELEALAHAHIGIAPLPDDSWTRGKCGLKILQYMAASLPVVASPVGANAEIIEDGRSGLFAQTPEEWQTALRKMTSDPVFRTRLGIEARRRVEANYDVSVGYRSMRERLSAERD